MKRVTHFFITAVETRSQKQEDERLAKKCVIDFEFAKQIEYNKKILGDDYQNKYAPSEYVKDSRCWGYVAAFEEAEQAVLHNDFDIHECNYQWAVIEEHYMGSYAMTTRNMVWYHWNNEKEQYEKADEPNFAHNIFGWGIG